jgi:hypothetical protein
MLPFIYWLSFVLLLATKAADVVSTMRCVDENAETNPLAGRLFRGRGVKNGIAIVCAVFLVIAGGQYLLVWWLCGPVLQILNAALGAAIAAVQWDVARFNWTGKASRCTRAVARFHKWWNDRWK